MSATPVAIVSPCFNEGSTAIAFLEELEKVLKSINESFIVVIVDDSSTDSTLTQLNNFSFSSSTLSLHIISLKFNLGHQGAIYQGLLYANSLPVSHVIVMDSDGEDDPAAIPFLLEKKSYDIVEVTRGRRSERLLFRVSYFFYKLLFRFITGNTMDFGNYCMINKKVLERVSHTSFVHFPAYLLKQKANKEKITWDRSHRIDGKSKNEFYRPAVSRL